MCVNIYLQTFRDRDGQDGRPRYVAAGCLLFGLTTHAWMVWSLAADQCLCRNKLAATMGVPCHLVFSIDYGLSTLSLDFLSRITLQQDVCPMCGFGHSLVNCLSRG